MFSKLSSREKGMLWGLLFLALIVGGIFLFITPALSSREELENQLLQAENQRGNMQQVIVDYDYKKEQLQETQKMLMFMQKNYTKLLTPEEMDILLEVMCAKHNLRKPNLSIGESKELDVNKLVLSIPNSAQVASGAAQSVVGGSGDQASDDSMIKPSTSTISLKILGTYSDMLNFLDEIETKLYTRTVTFRGSPEEYNSYDYDITIELYMTFDEEEEEPSDMMVSADSDEKENV